MNGTDFIKDYAVSEATPQMIQKSVFTAMEFAHGAKEFIEENFRGLADVECDVSVNFTILTSADFAAYFFKKLFTYIYGKIFVKIRFSTNEKQLNIAITSDSSFPFDSYETNDLIRQARNAGFEVYSADDGFTMALPILKEASMSIYAIPNDRGVQIVKQRFNNIFFYCDPPNSQ